MSEGNENPVQSDQSLMVGAPALEVDAIDPSVEFINEQVLHPDATSFEGTSKLVADQGAAMMIQDMRGFLQGSEQVFMLATAKAIKKTLSMNPIEREAGKEALEQILMCQSKLGVFAGEIGQAAGQIIKDFDGA